MKLTIFIHNYYEDTSFALYQKVKHLKKLGDVSQVLINLPLDHPQLKRISYLVEKKLPQAYIFKTSNVGKDIGGKLALLHLYLKLGFKSDLLVFLHDKKSPQTVIGDEWSNQLFSIVNPNKIQSIISLFSDNSVGMVGDENMVFSRKNKSEEELFAGNKSNVYNIAEKYGLSSKSLEFIGGTMFWVRESIFRSFFEKHCPISIRSTLEKGNVLDDLQPTITHSWERLFGWIVTSSGYKIKGL